MDEETYRAVKTLVDFADTYRKSLPANYAKALQQVENWIEEVAKDY